MAVAGIISSMRESSSRRVKLDSAVRELGSRMERPGFTMRDRKSRIAELVFTMREINSRMAEAGGTVRDCSSRIVKCGAGMRDVDSRIGEFSAAMRDVSSRTAEWVSTVAGRSFADAKRKEGSEILRSGGASVPASLGERGFGGSRVRSLHPNWRVWTAVPPYPFAGRRADWRAARRPRLRVWSVMCLRRAVSCLAVGVLLPSNPRNQVMLLVKCV